MNIANIYQLYSKFPKITTDSRKVEKNSIFFALRGNNFNGNKFAAEARQVDLYFQEMENRPDEA